MNCNKITYDKNCNIIIQEDSYDNNYAFVYILQLNQTTKITTLTFIKTSENDQVIFKSTVDGFYTLITAKVPINLENEYYYKDNKFYHLNEEISIQELIELNPNITKVKTTYEYYFQTCKLKKCFINLCYLIFDSQTPINCSSFGTDSNLIYKRDLIWAALNTIKYMTEMDQYEEAERLLERIMGCNGLCNNYCLDSNNISNCGCNK